MSLLQNSHLQQPARCKPPPQRNNLNHQVTKTTHLTNTLMAQKNYLECSPRRRPFEESSGQRYPGQVPTAEELEQPGVRRRHISAYIAFIRPEISHIISEYGRAAIKRVCQELYATGVRVTPSPWFGLMCERTMWRLCCELSLPAILKELC